MRHFWRFGFLLASAVVLNFQLAPAVQGAPATAKKTFTFRLLGEPETLDWNRAHTNVETHLLMNIMEGLVSFDSNFKVIPALASRWDKSADGKTYTFHLRKGVKWSDGVPLKAQDFVYSWKRLISPMTAAPYAYFLFDIENAEGFYKGTVRDFNQVGIKALDDETIQVKLVRPVAYWLYIPTFWVTFPLRKDIVDKYGSAWEKPGRMVTLGPYRLVAHDLDSKIVLEANPNYYGKRGNVEQAVGLVVKDDSTALTLYESGKLDFVHEIATVDLKRLKGRPDLKAFPYLRVGYLGFVLSKFPLTNVHARRAISMAIDKRQIPNVLQSGQVPALSLVPPKVMGYSDKMGLPFDPIKARAELKLAGIDPSQQFNLELVALNWDKPAMVAQFVQEQLRKNLGLNVSIQTYDHKTFRAQLDMYSFPMFQSQWGADYPDPDNFLSIFLSTSGNNRTNWKSKKFDDMVLEARYTSDAKARERAYLKAQRLLIEEEAVIVPLYYDQNMTLIRDRAKGVEMDPLNYFFIKKVSVN